MKEFLKNIFKSKRELEKDVYIGYSGEDYNTTTTPISQNREERVVVINSIEYAAQQFGNRSVSGFRQKREFDREWKDKMWEEDSFASELMNFIGNTDLHLGDLYRVNNWGVYKNNPVIIDLGLDQEIYDKHYRGK